MSVERMDPHIAEQRVLYTEHVVRYTFAASFAKGKCALDVGSGEGYGTGLLMRAGATAVAGVEIDPAVAARAHYRYLRDGMAFVAADGTRLPFADRSFDLITCFEVIEHVSEPQQRQLLDEFRRVLTDDGLLIISTPNRELYTPRVSEEILGLNPFHLHELTFDQFTAKLARRFPRITVIGQTPVPALLLPGGPAPGHDDRWYQAIHDTVYAIEPRGGDVAVRARLADPLAPELSLYMIALCGEYPQDERAAPRDGTSVAISRAEFLVYALWARWKVAQQELLDWLRDKNAAVEQTVIERTDWARSMEQSLARATIAIHGLENDLTTARVLIGSRDAELQRLRTRWAQIKASIRQLSQARRALEAQAREAAEARRALEVQAREAAEYAGLLERTLQQKDRHIQDLEARIHTMEHSVPVRVSQRLKGIRRR